MSKFKKFNFVIAGRDRYGESVMVQCAKPGQSISETQEWIVHNAPDRSIYGFFVPNANSLIPFGQQPIRTSVKRRIYHFEWFNRAHEERQAAMQTKKKDKE